jgi:hypothetical protein
MTKLPKKISVLKLMYENNHYLTTKIGARLYEQFGIKPFRHLNKHVCRPTNQKCAGQWNRQNHFHEKIIMKICQVTVVFIEIRYMQQQL